MTRRDLVQALALVVPAPETHLEITIRRVMDKYARSSPAQIRSFLSAVWNEAVRDFARGSITLRIVESEGEVLRHPSGRPSFKCLDRSMINVVLTDRVPVD